MKRYLAVQLMLVIIGAVLFIVGCRSQQASPTDSTGPATASTAAGTTLEKVVIAADEAACPVMGSVMKKSEMIPLQHDGKTYYMCCRSCVGKFTAEPEKYIANPAPAKRGM